MSFIFISRQISKLLSSKTVTLESHEIFDFVEAELVPQIDKGKLEVLVSVLACGFKSHFPHQCKGHSIFECPLFLYLGKSANYYHQKQSRWNRTKSLISWKRNLFRRLTKASLRCLCQYWRVGSSPISRTSVKDIRFSSVLYFCFSENLHIAVC